MSIKQTILDQIKDAMKAGDKPRLSALRMAKARLQEAEVAVRAKKGLDYEIDDDAATEVLSRHAKQLRESIEGFTAGGATERADSGRAELAIIETFLPKPLTEDEIRAIVRDAIEETGATEPKQMGLVMKAVMPRVKGAADGKLVKSIVGAELKV